MNKKKLSWGISGIIASLIVLDYAMRSFNDGTMPLVILFGIGATIGTILSIKEIIEAIRNKN